MFAARLPLPRFQVAVLALLLMASTAVPVVAQSSATYGGEQWRPAGVTRPTHVPTSASPNPSWRLPNNQSPSATANSEDAANPLRPKAKVETSNTGSTSAAPREPRPFQPPAHATRIAAANSVAPASAASPGPRQVQPAGRGVQPGNRPANAQPYTASRPTAPQRPSYQRPMQANNVYRHGVESPSENLWKTITVAFQGDAAPSAKSTPENLPVPSDARVSGDEPMLRHFEGPGAYIGPYSPYGEEGMCCDDGYPCGGCGDACGCGCECGDPGCGCEPGCGCGPGCGCDDCCRKDLFCIGPGDDESCHTVRFRWPKWQEVVVFGGVQGFKGPYDQTRDSGNFGFHEGFNIGAKIPYADLGYQFGWRGTQNQLNGDIDTGIDEQHVQQFGTAGVFHRQCTGLNFGVVWDVLSDERWDTHQFHQIRSEISLVNEGRHEIGFTGIFGGSSHTVNNESYSATDQYLLFYRLHGTNGGEGRFYAGFNDQSEGIIGSDMLLPVGDRFSVSAGFTYLIPDAPSGTEGASQEAWNIGVGLVWHWDRQARKSFENCYRPLFNVADNGTLIIND